MGVSGKTPEFVSTDVIVTREIDTYAIPNRHACQMNKKWHRKTLFIFGRTHRYNRNEQHDGANWMCNGAVRHVDLLRE